MKVYLAPEPGLSISLRRTADALARHAPPPIEVISSRRQADLVVVHAIGYSDALTTVEELCERGQEYAIVQHCMRASAYPITSDWLPIWVHARLVWSHYDLRAALLEDNENPDGLPLYHAPLGADSDIFCPAPVQRGRYAVLTSGHVPEWEAILEVAEATRRLQLRHFHLGPRLKGFGSHVTCSMGIDDATLARVYGECHFVSGLRRIEGFELPAAEGLLCGARPIFFDRPHYRAWFDTFAEFIPEGGFDDVVTSLEAVLRAGTRPVTDAERADAARRFDWREIARGFWDRILS